MRLQLLLAVFVHSVSLLETLDCEAKGKSSLSARLRGARRNSFATASYTIDPVFSRTGMEKKNWATMAYAKFHEGR